jgi:ribosome-interacting GTPase 1
MARTQKNKATAFHLGQLKAKLAKLKRELLTPSGGGGGGGVGFDVARTGVASVYVSTERSLSTSIGLLGVVVSSASPPSARVH